MHTFKSFWRIYYDKWNCFACMCILSYGMGMGTSARERKIGTAVISLFLSLDSFDDDDDDDRTANCASNASVKNILFIAYANNG